MAVLRFPKPEVLAQIPEEGDVVIEASAGTGKTFTLERLIIDLMLGDFTPDNFVPVEQILVVTFTERATRELKARVRNLLEKIVTTTENCAEDTPHWKINDEARIWLERQLFMFDRAPIHTIHGWCHRVLTENAFFIGKLLDQEHADAQRIFDKAFVRALRNQFAVDERYAPYLSAWLETHSIDRLRQDLATLIRTKSRIKPDFDPKAFLARVSALKAYNRKQVIDAYYDINPWGIHQKVEDTDKIGYLLDQLAQVAGPEDIPAALMPLSEQDAGWYNVQAYEGYMNNAQGPMAALKQVLGTIVPLRAATLNVFAEAMRRVLADQKSQGFFDYDDMLSAVWQKLDDDTASGRELLNHLRNRYKYALIDEFQDTDEVQWNIFRKIFHVSNRHRMFVIGDPKQAIYAFRGADVHTYLHARREIAGDSPHVVLKQNFRSTKNLIAAYNHIFDQSVEEPVFTGEITYSEPVTCGKPQAFEAEFESGIPDAPLILVRMEPDGEKIWAADLKRRHGAFIAKEIQRICEEDVLKVDDEGELRPIRPKDIFILTHTRTEERLIGEHLKAAGVPFAFYKQEGLFQTPEALDVLELLVAIEDPYLRSNRLKVWATPFFSIEFDRLQACAELPETHPLFERLVRWHETARASRFDQLFNDILEHSGLIRREIFLKDNERELTNYQHIFEVLLEEVHTRGLDLRELILRLRGLHDETNVEQSDERNIQRLETEKDAVQVMTMHKSKGLEAEVVFVYGGWTKRPTREFNTCHWKQHRILYIGMPYLLPAKTAVELDEIEEAQRLLYVAATRAKSKLYMPVIGTKNGKLEFGYLEGVQKAINHRLVDIARDQSSPHIRLHNVPDIPDDLDESEPPPEAKLELSIEPVELPDSDLDRVRPTTRLVTSYSRMKAAKGGYKGPADDDADALALEMSIDTDDERLPGGTSMGLFLHDILEHSDFVTPDTLEEFAEVNSELFEAMMERHKIDERWRTEIEQMIYKVLQAPVGLPDTTMANLGAVDRDVREMEFLFPIPENSHPDLAQLRGEVEVKRGFIKGYIDLLFEFDGKIYFADWKSDTLEDYEDESLTDHVAKNYATQAMLYSLATMSQFGLLDRESYDSQFGGYLYVFLRGTGASNHGMYSARPTYDEVVAYRASLMSMEMV